MSIFICQQFLEMLQRAVNMKYHAKAAFVINYGIQILFKTIFKITDR